MRRGMLMTVLQQYALEQPVWRGKPGEKYERKLLLSLTYYATCCQHAAYSLYRSQ